MLDKKQLYLCNSQLEVEELHAKAFPYASGGTRKAFALRYWEGRLKRLERLEKEVKEVKSWTDIY